MNRNLRPVMFAFEPDVVSVFANLSFGAAGAVTLNQTQSNSSKGICNVAATTIAFTGTSSNSSTSVTAVSSFAGLYVGMTITGTNIPASTTIASMNAGAGTLTLSQAATGTNAGLTAGGGLYTVTFGSQFTPFKRLDAYVKLLAIKADFDVSGVQGGASTLALAPAGSNVFVVANNISNSTLANLVLQFGTGSGTSFVATNPGNGERCRISFKFSRSTAI